MAGKQDGQVRSLQAEQLLLFTMRAPDANEAEPLEQLIQDIIGRAKLGRGDLGVLMTELGAARHLRDVFGTAEMPGALRSSVTTHEHLLLVLDRVLMLLRAGRDRQAAATAPPPAQESPVEAQSGPAPHARTVGGAPVHLSDDELHARGLLDDDDRRPGVPRRLRAH